MEKCHVSWMPLFQRVTDVAELRPKVPLSLARYNSRESMARTFSSPPSRQASPASFMVKSPSSPGSISASASGSKYKYTLGSEKSPMKPRNGLHELAFDLTSSLRRSDSSSTRYARDTSNAPASGRPARYSRHLAESQEDLPTPLHAPKPERSGQTAFKRISGVWKMGNKDSS